jgi:hypothetical protein
LEANDHPAGIYSMQRRIEQNFVYGKRRLMSTPMASMRLGIFIVSSAREYIVWDQFMRHIRRRIRGADLFF